MLFYLKTKEYQGNGHYSSEMYIINALTGVIVKKSILNTIASKEYDVCEKGVVVIAHKGSYSSSHNLILLDRKDLKVVNRGTNNIFWRSFVEIRKNFIFAIFIQNGKYFLGKFDLSMKLVAKSEEELHQDTFITFYGDKIYVNNSKKNILVMDKTLKKIKVIKS